ncbi:MAG: hypothetical protein HS111_18095 [Kofleriaceae bacterium]|nr:hypothetical protein [Kofleriaceae bacterium]
MKAIGEEATHFAVAPLRPGDWVNPSYREQGAWFWRGYTIKDFINQLFGNVADPVKEPADAGAPLGQLAQPGQHQLAGRHPDPAGGGPAYAAKLLGKDDVSMVYFGEGTSSTGEFHVGMNFAGVWKAPCVFICRNNGWAISVPREKQTAAKTFAFKAVGYPMPGIVARRRQRPVLAMLQVAGEAIDQRPRRRRPDDDRGPHLPRPGPLQLRRPVGLPRPQGAGSCGSGAIRSTACATTCATARWGRVLGTSSPSATTRRSIPPSPPPSKLGRPPLEAMFEDVCEDALAPAEQKAWLLAQARTRSIRTSTAGPGSPHRPRSPEPRPCPS